MNHADTDPLSVQRNLVLGLLLALAAMAWALRGAIDPELPRVVVPFVLRRAVVRRQVPLPLQHKRAHLNPPKTFSVSSGSTLRCLCRRVFTSLYAYARAVTSQPGYP